MKEKPGSPVIETQRIAGTGTVSPVLLSFASLRSMVPRTRTLEPSDGIEPIEWARKLMKYLSFSQHQQSFLPMVEFILQSFEILVGSDNDALGGDRQPSRYECGEFVAHFVPDTFWGGLRARRCPRWLPEAKPRRLGVAAFGW